MEDEEKQTESLPTTQINNTNEVSPESQGSSRVESMKTVSIQDEDQNDDKSTTDSAFDRLLTRYARFIVGYPYANIIIICILFIWAVVIGFTQQLGAQKLPDFTKPTKGFEPRDTQISNSKHAYNNLKQLYDNGGLQNKPIGNTAIKLRRSLAELEKTCIYSGYYEPGDIENNKIVYEDVSGGNMLNANNMKDVCSLQERIMEKNPLYGAEVRRSSDGRKCPSHSIPNYLRILGNHSSCSKIKEADVTLFQSILHSCVSPFKDGSLQKCLTDPKSCKNLAPNCTKHAHIIFYTFRFLSDSNFVHNPNFLKLTLVSERLTNSYDSPLYESVFNDRLKDLSDNIQGNVKVSSFHFGDMKFKLFERKLFMEGALLSFAVLIVFVLIMVYSRSIFIGLMTFLCIIIAAVLAYFFYGIAFRLSFFPFLNVLTLIFLVGIGADDAFVYMGAWKEAMELMPCDNINSIDNALVQWTVYSLKHAVVAMFVTSFTTAAAFFAGAASNIIAIRCFGIFAGTSILMNYLMMVFWFPVAVIISFKYFGRCSCLHSCCHQSTISSSTESDEQRKSGVLSKLSSLSVWLSKRLFKEIIPNIVTKLQYAWITIFGLLGAGGILVIFVSPKLQLPISKDFQMFSDSSSIEQFPLHYKSRFSTDTFSMTVFFVFGVSNENTASMMNPDEKGTVKLINKFSITSPAEQNWLKSFCEQLQNASFIAPSLFNQGTCYTIISKFQALTLPCNSSYASKPPCCGRTLPLPKADFQHCLTGIIVNTSTFSNFNGLLIDGNNQLRAIVIRADTRFQFTEAYDKADEFFTLVNLWFQSIKQSAPESFQSGFWHSYLEFYDLQKSLATGTQVSLAISVAIAFGVVLLTTWNLLISFYTIIAISFVISTSIGTLVLAGWRLNIMESIIFSVAAGLAVDFTLHYGVAYRCATDKRSRAKRVKYSFQHLGSAIAMGAFTTFVSGLAMAPSTVRVYIQLSHFLMVLMTFSWLYANFFFMALCSTSGPENNFCQLNYAGLFFKNKRNKQAGLSDDTDGYKMQTIAT